MRISDWSSDVCSSDLGGLIAVRLRRGDNAKAVVRHIRIDPDRWHLWGGYLRPRDKFLLGKIANLLAVSRVHSAPKNNEVVFGKHLDFLREHQRPKLVGLRGRVPPRPSNPTNPAFTPPISGTTRQQHFIPLR